MPSSDEQKSDEEALVALLETWMRSRPRDAALLQAGLSGDGEALTEAASSYGAAESVEEVTGSKETLSLRGGRYVWATDDDFDPRRSDFAPPQGLVDTLRRPTSGTRLCLKMSRMPIRGASALDDVCANRGNAGIFEREGMTPGGVLSPRSGVGRF